MYYVGQNIFFYLNHPIKWVRLVGVVVAFDLLPTRFIFGLDDSSGFNIEIMCERPKGGQTIQAQDMNPDALLADQPGMPMKGCTASGREVELAGIDVGAVVKAKGTIGVFRGARQLLLERIAIVRTTNAEATAWTENTAFHDDVLSKPWNLSEREQRRAKNKAEGRDRGRKSRTGEMESKLKNTDNEKVRERVRKDLVMDRKRIKKAEVRKSERLEREKELQRHLERREEINRLEEATEIGAISRLVAKGSGEQDSSDIEKQNGLTAPQRMNDSDFSKEKLRIIREADRAERERTFAMHVKSKKSNNFHVYSDMGKPSRKERRADHF